MWVSRDGCRESVAGPLTMWQSLMLEAVGEVESAGGMGNREQWGLVRDAELIQICTSKVSALLYAPDRER